ncbi:YsnF/AvaK domain-containing protein [Flaviaesturariibacter terrae]
MAQTVVGFFDRNSDAQEAIRTLMSRGIGRDRIDLSSGGRGSTDVSSGRSGDAARGENPISNFFRNLFGSDKASSERYTRVAERSNTIVTVHAVSRDEAETASQILDRCGAIDVDERDRAYGIADTRSERGSEGQPVSDERTTTIPRVEEHLELGKREVERGGVQIRSRIVEQPVQENIRLREEHVTVERTAVDRPLNGNEGEAFRERNIELTERAEVPVVNKEARVVEEVRVRKEVTERNETIRDTLRRTDIDVDKTNERGRSSTDPGRLDDTNSRPL